MSRNVLFVWIATMAVLGLTLIVLGVTGNRPVLIGVGAVFLAVQAIKWRLLRRDEP